MDKYFKELFDVLTEIAENKKLDCTVKSSIAGGAIAGAGALLGGLFGGRNGALIGSAVGGLISTLAYKDSYKSVVTVLKEMPDEDKKRLCDKVIVACRKYGAFSARALAPLLLKRMDVQDEAMRIVMLFLETSSKLVD